jgi:hypothetical protein
VYALLLRLSPAVHDSRPRPVWGLRLLARRAAVLRVLDVVGIGDRPSDPLDQLGRGVVVAEMVGIDPLVEQHGPIGALARFGRHDDSCY